VIHDRKSGLSKRRLSRLGDSSTSKTEAIPQVSRRRYTSSHRQVVRPRRSVGGRRWRLLPGGGDLGPDCVLSFYSKVLSVICQGCDVSFLFCKVLGVTLYPPF
jgi:hypothetical protein